MEISSFEKTKVGGNIENVGNFKMKASAKAFRILADGLYQNKIAAVIRELSTNAVDSHVAAGKPSEPFLVHIPSHQELWFSVRDFGVGMSPDMLEDLYVTFFDSTKTTSNDFTGCLGLGSKSPFSYTDNFTISSVWEGEKRTYLARLDSAGMPCIDLLSKEPTDEPVGIEVRVNVKNNDVGSWEREAVNIYPWFSTLPNWQSTKPEIVEQIISRHKSFFSELIGNKENIEVYSNGSVQSRIVMGNVAYPIPNAVEFWDSQSSSKIEEILNLTGWVIKVPIGFLDIAASRESLSIDTNTKKNLQKITVIIRDLLTENIQKSIKSVNSVYEGICLLDEIQKQFPKLKVTSSSLFNLNFKVDGVDIQKVWYSPTSALPNLSHTVAPKFYDLSVAVCSEDADGKKGWDVIESCFEKATQSLTKTTKYLRNPKGRINKTEIETYDAYGNPGTQSIIKGINKGFVILIDGEKELVYERVIEEFLKEKLQELKKEAADHLSKATNFHYSFNFNVYAYVVKAYENESRLEEKAAQNFLKRCHLESENVVFISDIKEKYKIVKTKTVNSGNKNKQKKKKEAFELTTYKLLNTSYSRNLQQNYGPVVISEDQKDQTIDYIERDGIYWKMDGFAYGQKHPNVSILFDFVKHFYKKDKTVYCLTQTQIERLEKKGFELNNFTEEIKTLFEKELSNLESLNPILFFDFVHNDVGSTHIWRNALIKAKNKNNEEFIDFILDKKLVVSDNKNTLFDKEVYAKFQIVKSMAYEFCKSQPYKIRVENIEQKIEKEKQVQKSRMVSGEAIIQKMIKEIPPLVFVKDNLYNIGLKSGYYAANVEKGNQCVAILEFLQKMEVHKKP